MIMELYEIVIYFLVGIKTLEISAYIYNRIFTKNVNNFEVPRQIFPNFSK